MKQKDQYDEGYIQLRVSGIVLHGNLLLPKEARGLVIFAHGSGSSRHSPRNQYVARILRGAGFGTLLFDLLTLDEEAEDLITGRQRFDIKLLANRLGGVIDLLQSINETQNLRLGYFGASTGAAAALVSAAERATVIGAIVSRGGRPDLAGQALLKVKAPTLLIVGGSDFQVIEMNRLALAKLQTDKQLITIPGATHLFEEQGALEQVAELASTWFARYLAPKSADVKKERTV